MKTDPGIEPTRETRQEISQRVDHDPKKLIRHYVEYQKRFSSRLRPATTEQPVSVEQ